MSTPAKPVRSALQRMACVVMSHRPVRTITDLQWGAAWPQGSFEITGSRVDCERCGKGLS